jgi:hypothetical protein
MMNRTVNLLAALAAGTPAEFGAFMKAGVGRWTQVVERGGIKPE